MGERYYITDFDDLQKFFIWSIRKGLEFWDRRIERCLED